MVEVGTILGFESAIIGALVGSVSAFMFTRHLMIKKQANELKKLKQIINDEFYRIHYYANESVKIIMEAVKNYEEFHEHVLDIRHEIIRGRSPLLLDLPYLRFLLWNSITSSGKMMELKTDEIQLINAAHNNTEDCFASISYITKQFDQKMRYTEENPVQYSIEKIEIYTNLFYAELKTQFHLIAHQFNVLDKKIDWIKSDFSTKTFKKINEEFADYPQEIFSTLPFPNKEFEKKSPI